MSLPRVSLDERRDQYQPLLLAEGGQASGPSSRGGCGREWRGLLGGRRHNLGYDLLQGGGDASSDSEDAAAALSAAPRQMDMSAPSHRRRRPGKKQKSRPRSGALRLGASPAETRVTSKAPAAPPRQSEKDERKWRMKSSERKRKPDGGLARGNTTGCCWCNCCKCVRQDEYVAGENFGRFSHMLTPGFNCLGIDACGCCIQLTSISRRVHQTTVITQAVTKDHVSVAVKIAVQQAVRRDKVYEAFYQLDDISQQVEAFVADAVLTEVPHLTLEDIFLQMDNLGLRTQATLRESMAPFGVQVLKVLVLEAKPDSEVVSSMNEIMIQRNIRSATITAAEAAAIRCIKAAEANAEAMRLRGEGAALRREAIAQGLSSCVLGDVDALDRSATAVTELLLVTEYFDTLREICARGTAEAVFVNCERDRRREEPDKDDRSLDDGLIAARTQYVRDLVRRSSLRCDRLRIQDHLRSLVLRCATTAERRHHSRPHKSTPLMPLDAERRSDPPDFHVKL